MVWMFRDIRCACRDWSGSSYRSGSNHDLAGKEKLDVQCWGLGWSMSPVVKLSIKCERVHLTSEELTPLERSLFTAVATLTPIVLLLAHNHQNNYTFFVEPQWHNACCAPFAHKLLITVQKEGVRGQNKQRVLRYKNTLYLNRRLPSRYSVSAVGVV